MSHSNLESQNDNDGVQAPFKFEPSSPPPEDGHLWFPDGNIVLATDSRLFCVHKGVLALQSTVFKDMFDFPTPSNGQALGEDAMDGDVGLEAEDVLEKQEMYGGRQFVVLAGDRGEDVVHLLRAIYEREYYDRDNDSTPLEIIIALLLLSTKYDVPSIRSEVVKHLLRHYPTSLTDFDAVDDNAHDLFGRKRLDCHFDLLRAALKADVDILLPGLYYACTAFSISDIFDKEAHTLDLGTLKVLLVGARRLESAIRSLLLLILDGVTSSSRASICPGASAAAAGGSQCKIHRRKRSFAMSSMFNTTRLVEVKGKDVVEHCLKNGCEACRASIAAGIDDARTALWGRMPGVFEFSSWEVLMATVKR
ncbi:hypothetical protein SCHPADRAFT_946373 [Schizopora paradoxa]|uniref:BTB domain-containing protein n=1 Tax=Schizopora paradoxa TaxID=27342 RepID=A0A0H2RMP9_9AGAM|nr:hypothetical protein SCHPADRAFT_946373 [Schizopora paradoxa]